jgi:hypothetical protein
MVPVTSATEGMPDVLNEVVKVARSYAIPLHQRMDNRIGKDIV